MRSRRHWKAFKQKHIMKKHIFAVIAAVLLLSGCNNNVEPGSETGSSVTGSAASPSEPEITVSDYGNFLGMLSGLS